MQQHNGHFNALTLRDSTLEDHAPFF